MEPRVRSIRLQIAVFITFCVTLFLGAGPIAVAKSDSLGWLDQYNVVWQSPSEHAGQSMPVGGHDIGLNVWVEDGDVLFYVGQAGCRDENGALLKHGRVRLELDPNPFVQGGQFRQVLNLRESCIEITGNAPGAPNTTVRLWVEVGRPVVHVDVQAQKPVETSATFETWRYRDRQLRQRGTKHGPRAMAMMNRTGYPEKVWLYGDTIEPNQDRVVWYHRMRNEKGVFAQSVRQQNLEPVRDDLYDPLTNLTFGGLLAGKNLELTGKTKGVYAQTSYRGWRYGSVKPRREQHIRLVCHIDQSETVAQWKQALRVKAAAKQPTREAAWQRNLDWWGQFWRRSHIVINSGAGPDNRAWQVGRNYNLARYMLACNRAGREPTMFNGGLFTYDPLYIGGKPAANAGPDAVDKGWTPDHRQWGAGFTAQNQRLLYWNMLRSSDYDIMQPGLDFYRRGLASAEARVEHYWGHEGACFVEQISAQALPGMAMWGFVGAEGRRSRPENYKQGVQVNGATRYLYQSQLEFAFMALQYHRYSGKSLEPYMPFIDAAVQFYDEHYQMRKQRRDGQPLNQEGHLVITPSRACESYEQAVNPTDAVAGLRAVLSRLITLNDGVISPEKKAEYRAMLGRIPPIPTMQRSKTKVLAPAKSWGKAHSKEMPELYPVFPYNLYGLGRDRFKLARSTWQHTPGSKDYISWHQGNIFAARLGLRETAKDYAIKKLADADRRFPTFWGPGHDWVPDHNWAGSGMIGLQEMLVQSHNQQLWVLPAWPKKWDVDFKLHAPHDTVIEGRFNAGQLQSLNVTPADRRENVTIKH